MNKILIFKIDFTYDNIDQVSLDNFKYKYSDFSKNIIIEDTLKNNLFKELEDYYNGNGFSNIGNYGEIIGPGGGGLSASQYKSNISGSFKTEDSSIVMHFNIMDLNQITAVSSDIKFIINKAFNNSDSIIDNILLSPTTGNKDPNGNTYVFPNNPVYELINDESDESINPYDGFINAGGWYIKYNIKAIESGSSNLDINNINDVTVNSKDIDESKNYNFKVEPNDTLTSELGTFKLIGNGIIDFIYSDDVMLSEEYIEEDFSGSQELADEILARYELQNQDISEVEANTDLLPQNDTGSYVGGEWKNYDINKILSKISQTMYKTTRFIDSLRKILLWIKNDKTITDIRQASYLLGTAFAESGYSLQRWEADYVCVDIGKKYGPSGPCSGALSYYKSTKGGKANYYNLGVDNRGLPFFGRGLIQLTGKGNYKKYGDKIGVDLIANPELAITEENSYKIAVVYLHNRTFKYVIAGNLAQARRSVNGGTKKLDEVNSAYRTWLNIFKQNNT